ncbi:MAG: RDD family protein [Cyclobacteriaceae bacterium]|nr:RDD family protein [Cyclobacteriaceae bacterium]
MEEQITQPEGISTKAGLGDRFLGVLIDWLVCMVFYYVLDMFIGWGISYGIGAIYFLVRDALPFLDGQSIGKKVMKTRAVKEDSGAPLTNDYATSLIRNIPAVIPVVSLVDAIFILLGDERKRLGDKIGKTIVVKE